MRVDRRTGLFTAVSLLVVAAAAHAAVEVTPGIQAELDRQKKIAAGWAADPVNVKAVAEQNAKGPLAGMDNSKWKLVRRSDPLVRAFQSNPAGQFLRSKMEASGGLITEAFVSAAQGEKVAFAEKTTSYIHKGMPKFDVPFTSRSAWQGRPEFDESAQTYQIQISVPVLVDGQPAGALVVGISLSLLERWREYTAIPATEAERQLWPAFSAAVREWEQASRDTVRVLSEDTPSARRDAIDLSVGEGTIKFENARKILSELTAMRMAQAERHAKTEEARAAAMLWWVVIAVAGAMGLALVLSVVLGRSIANPLGQTATLLRDIAEGEGDLTRRPQVRSRDELGELARWFNTFVDKLRVIIGQTRESAERAALAAQQLSTGTEQISGAAQEQASSLEETAASMEELTGTVKQNADNARQASQLAVESRDTAER